MRKKLSVPFPLPARQEAFKSAFLYNQKIRVCVSCFWWCPGTSGSGWAHLPVSMFMCSSLTRDIDLKSNDKLPCVIPCLFKWCFLACLSKGQTVCHTLGIYEVLTAWSSNGDIWDSSYFHALFKCYPKEPPGPLLLTLWWSSPKKVTWKTLLHPWLFLNIFFSILGKIIDLFIVDKLHIDDCQKFTIDDKARDEWKC